MLIIYSKDLVKGCGGKGCKIRDKYSNNNTVSDFRKEGWIYKEIKCALRDDNNNSINGLLVLVPDNLWDFVYEKSKCSLCKISTISLNSSAIPKIIGKNHFNVINKYKHSNCEGHYDLLLDSYIPIIKLSKFKDKPMKYIESAKEKRKIKHEFEIIKSEKKRSITTTCQ